MDPMSTSPLPTDLPIEACLPELQQALADHRQAVLTAEPGAGKTTIVPLRLLDEPWLAGRTIVMLEPRRMAARCSTTHGGIDRRRRWANRWLDHPR